ncbi:MAG: HEPN domain-containing protein [Dehalococcoidia bacterium]
MGQEFGNWMRTARRDVRVARLTLKEGEFDSAVFHAHQTAEEALNALWAAQTGELPPRTHNLPDLATGLNASAAMVEGCRRLNPHYAASRYPDAANGDPAGNYSFQIASDFVSFAEEVLEWCSSQLPS